MLVEAILEQSEHSIATQHPRGKTDEMQNDNRDLCAIRTIILIR